MKTKCLLTLILFISLVFLIPGVSSAGLLDLFKKSSYGPNFAGIEKFQVPDEFKEIASYSETIKTVSEASKLDTVDVGELGSGLKRSLIKSNCSGGKCVYCVMPKFDGSGEEEMLGRKAFKIYSHPNGLLIATLTDVCFGIPVERQIPTIGGGSTYTKKETEIYRTVVVSYTAINTKQNIAVSLSDKIEIIPYRDKYDIKYGGVSLRIRSRISSIRGYSVIAKTIMDMLSKIDLSNKERFDIYAKTWKPYFTISDCNMSRIFHEKDIDGLIKGFVNEKAVIKPENDNSSPFYIGFGLLNSPNKENFCKYYSAGCKILKEGYKQETSEFISKFLSEFMNTPVKYRIEMSNAGFNPYSGQAVITYHGVFE